MKKAKIPGRKVPSRAVQAHAFTEYPNHDTIWAIAAGSEGLIHIAVCCESIGGGVVQLCSYDVDRRKARHELDVAQFLGEPPDNGHASHGKIHFSLCPSKDGFLYAATHCSTPPLGDRSWDAHVMYNDGQRSFAGGHFFRFHPLTQQGDDFRILFPHEGVGVLALDETTCRCVGVTYPTGRMFFIDKDGKEFVDAGRVAERYTLSLIGDGKGAVYGTDTYGYFLRMDMKNRSVEHLTSRMPTHRAASGRYISMSDSAWGPDGFVYALCYRVPNLFRFRPAPTGPIHVEDLGPLHEDKPPIGMAFAGDGNLYTNAGSCLIRWDIRKRSAENLGSIYVDGAERRYWRCVKGKDGRLYGGECGRKPVSLIIIDPEKL